jgi:hypothetical protein
MNIAHAFLRLGVICGLVGMAGGVAMGVSQNFTLAPAHAHLNLLGWVSMMLYALFYERFPGAARSRLAGAHFLLNAAGVVAQVAGLALVVAGRRWAEPIMATGATAVLASMLLFAAIVFRATSGRPGRQDI